MFYGPITEEEDKNLPQPLEPDVVEIEDIFILARRNNFRECLCVWKMVVSEENENNNDLHTFARARKAQFTDLVERVNRELKGVKVSFGLKVEFSILRNGKTENMEHYFREEELHIFNRHVYQSGFFVSATVLSTTIFGKYRLQQNVFFLLHCFRRPVETGAMVFFLATRIFFCFVLHCFRQPRKQVVLVFFFN